MAEISYIFHQKSLGDYIYEGVSLEELENLTKKRSWTVEDARANNNNALRLGMGTGIALGRNRFEAVKWLANKFNLTIEDARTDDNEALRWGMVNGQLEAIQWLVDYFGLTVEDVRANYNELLGDGIKSGQLACVKWLVNKFNLTVDDVQHSGQNSALLNGVRNNHFKTVGWLIWWFGMDDYFGEMQITDEKRNSIREELTKLRPGLIKAAVKSD